MEFDLNQEPPNESMFGLQTLLSELETAHGCIEERIRQLEAVISRATQRQIWRQNHTTTHTPLEAAASQVQSDDSPLSGAVVVSIQGRNSEARETVKMNNTNLIANALSRETDSKKTNKGKEGFFDCNVCLEMARDPILTSCGHLFCWPCFYSCSYIGLSEMKECPVCMEKITDKSIIPIYGNGNASSNQKSRFEESGLMVPPRPSAHRVEGLRQRLMAPGGIFPLTFPSSQLRNIIAAGGPRSQSLNSENIPERSRNVDHVRSQLMRSMLDRSASFSSLSNALNSAMSSVNSAMSSAARLIQDLEASINSHQTTTISRQSSIDADRDSFSSIAAVIQQDSQTLNNAADIDSTVAQTVSSSRNSDAVMPVSSSSSRRAGLSRVAEVSTSVEVNSTTPNSSSSRRRRGVPLNSDVENDRPRDPTRRRLM